MQWCVQKAQASVITWVGQQYEGLTMDDQKQQITSNSDSGPCDIHSIHEQVSAMSVSEKSTILHVSAKQLPDTSDSGSNVHVQCDARLNVHTPRSMTDKKSSTHVLTMCNDWTGIWCCCQPEKQQRTTIFNRFRYLDVDGWHLWHNQCRQTFSHKGWQHQANHNSISYVCTWSWCLSCCRGWWYTAKSRSDNDRHLYFLLLVHSRLDATLKQRHSNKDCFNSIR